MTLDELALKHGTDKSTLCHGYTLLYEKILAGREIKKILEIGVAKGASLKMWREYFPDAKVFGMDTNWKHVQANADCILGDQGNIGHLSNVIAVTGGDFDLIVDDGSHKKSDVDTSVKFLWPYLRKGGVYAIEDLDYGGVEGITFLVK